MRIESLPEIVQHLATGKIIRREQEGHDPADYWLEIGRFKIPDNLIERMIREGWLQSFNGGYRLTDAGHAAYMRSTDELGDGRLVSPNDKS